jgi:hypothetical protein
MCTVHIKGFDNTYSFAARFEWMLRSATIIMFSKRGLDIGRVIEDQTRDRLDALKEVRFHAVHVLFSF